MSGNNKQLFVFSVLKIYENLSLLVQHSLKRFEKWFTNVILKKSSSWLYAPHTEQSIQLTL